MAEAAPGRDQEARSDATRDRCRTLARRHHAAADPRGAPRRRHRHPWAARPPPRRPGGEFLAVPPLRVGRAGAAGRLAPLRARRPSLCARAGMGSRAYGVDLARPLALHGVRLAAGGGDQARPRAGRRLRARRGPGRGRRAHRHPGHHAADRKPQRDRADGRGDRPRPDRAREPAALVLAVAARRGRGAVGPVEPDRRGACDHRAALRQRARTATSCRSSIRSRRPSRFPAASSSSSRKARAPSRPAAPRPGASSTRSGWSVTAPRSAPRPTGSAGRSSIHRTDRPATDLLLWLHSSMGAGPQGTGINRWHALPASGRLP